MKTAQQPEQNPHILRALAVLHAGLGIKPVAAPAVPVTRAKAAPVASAQPSCKATPPAKAKQATKQPKKATASKAPPTGRSVWFYLTKGAIN